MSEQPPGSQTPPEHDPSPGPPPGSPGSQPPGPAPEPGPPGYQPPPSSGGYQPPPSSGGYQPPPSSGGLQPPMPPPPPPTYGSGGGYAAAPPNDSQSTLALILGILSCLCCPILGPVAFFIGNSSLTRIRASGGMLGGEGMAQAGRILGIIGTVFLALGILYWIAVGIGVASSLRSGG